MEGVPEDNLAHPTVGGLEHYQLFEQVGVQVGRMREHH